ncbi:YeaC family protein [Vibrio sp. SCSIO 43137]|uniref:YeaC family protein n=1 Tax=Vibrio sp. SCSIO 43137 TaxID=3021011 RepID=UPI002307A37A|nr:YeaC family protein [Vibrio sp. SCSIO 43137]WCE30659.1 YeaC family protein [Vibrio sp. SCSIO 43137]
MNTEQLVRAITPEAYERLLYAVETGKWPDGTALSQEQRDSCMQAVMLYQSKHNTEAEHMTVAAGGEISFKSKSELKKVFKQGSDDIVRVKVNE